MGEKRGLAECLASVAGAAKQAQQAARLLGAAEALREATKAPVPPSDRPAYDRSVAAVYDLFPHEVIAAAWAEGRAMTLEQAIEYALAADAQGLTTPSSERCQWHVAIFSLKSCS